MSFTTPALFAFYIALAVAGVVIAGPVGVLLSLCAAGGSLSLMVVSMLSPIPAPKTRKAVR